MRSGFRFAIAIACAAPCLAAELPNLTSQLQDISALASRGLAAITDAASAAPPHPAADLSNLTPALQNISAAVFPDLVAIAADVHEHPETSTEEFHAHNAVVQYFAKINPGLWEVTPSAFGEPTAWTLEFENRPRGYRGELPAVGFMSEYDALVGIGHACGHNLILLNGIAAAAMARQAVIDFDIPARLIVVGTPDEEDTGGKHRLEVAGAFKDSDVWMMAHPATSNIVSPLGARANALLEISGKTHAEAVKKAYKELVTVVDLAGKLPGDATTAVPVENVGMFASNIVQTRIDLGVAGLPLDEVNKTIADIGDDHDIEWAVSSSENGVDITFEGRGGHGSEGSFSALSLSVEVFRQLSASHPDVSYYLPSNTSHTELDITINVRSRYTLDMEEIKSSIQDAVECIPDSIEWDLQYPATEVTPFLPDLLIEVMSKPEYGSQKWTIINTTPAATDASFVQQAVVDPETRKLVKAKRAVFHPNFSICEESAKCPYNHEPEFAHLAGTDFAYAQTEKMARSLAEIAVKLLNDKELMDQATAITR
ncbi:hypothetical protein AJ80_05950 [Polytolypa hystricis UAMH7299]|uniref:Peptidase M20 dimerisation domain-containing protein n=1 Tax=Polytolypa hystricis (strain UAMH7299) TaxID=1447883 RepID=A0A2B7XZB4_POLH7|nr:hypothetical protein AJ80_05950 [Polytolypa hystricis UAMH7299]